MLEIQTIQTNNANEPFLCTSKTHTLSARFEGAQHLSEHAELKLLFYPSLIEAFETSPESTTAKRKMIYCLGDYRDYGRVIGESVEITFKLENAALSSRNNNTKFCLRLTSGHHLLYSMPFKTIIKAQQKRKADDCIEPSGTHIENLFDSESIKSMMSYAFSDSTESNESNVSNVSNDSRYNELHEKLDLILIKVAKIEGHLAI